jgi:hypothetical protein
MIAVAINGDSTSAFAHQMGITVTYPCLSQSNAALRHWLDWRFNNFRRLGVPPLSDFAKIGFRNRARIACGHERCITHRHFDRRCSDARLAQIALNHECPAALSNQQIEALKLDIALYTARSLVRPIALLPYHSTLSANRS